MLYKINPAEHKTVNPNFEFNRIITGDCLEVMSQIPDNTVHFAVTSPPYNVGIEYDKHKKNCPNC